MKALLRRPLPWAAVSGLALLAALALPPTAPAGLFWSLTAFSCLGAALVVWFDERS